MALLFVTSGAVARQGPPAQVNVPSFTPVSPQAYREGTDLVPLSEMGIVTSADCKSEQDAWVSANLVDAQFRNRSNGNSYFSTSAEERYKYLGQVYFKDEGTPRNQIKSGNLTRSRLRENLQFFAERSKVAVPECTDINSCVQSVSLRDSRLQACIWSTALNRAGQQARPATAAAPRTSPAPASGSIFGPAITSGVAGASSSGGASAPAPRAGGVSSFGGASASPTRAAVASAPADSFKQKLDQTGLKYEMDKDGDYKILFNVGDTKRTQLVYVSGDTQTIGGLVIREFFAPAAKVSVAVDGAKALELLAESHRKKVGSWEIHGDGLNYTAKVSDSISAKDARSLLETIVNIADEAEAKLTGKDDY